jgi:hypothetical protein
VLVLALVAGVVAQHRRDQRPEPPVLVRAGELMPTASASSLSSTWYCAGGTATGTTSGKGAGAAEQTLVIQNASTQSLAGRVTAMTDTGKSVTKSITVAARGFLDVQVSDLVKADYAAAVVEVSGGEVAVSHVLRGPTGTAVAACSSSASSTWYVPSGSTQPGMHLLLALFNPFPSDAIATVTFATDAGARTPETYDAMVIPGGRVTVLDVTSVVTLRTQLATTVAVREGRLIVDQIQSADGTAGTAKGLAVTPAAPRGSSSWWFADGPATQGARIQFVVQNVGSESADVQLHVRLDQADRNGTVSPFEATVPAGSYWFIDLARDSRVPVGVGFTATATAADGRPIVVDRVVTAKAPANPNGFDVSLGSPLLADRWLVPFASSSAVHAATLIVTNPSASHSIKVNVSTVTNGLVTPLQGTNSVEVIPAGGRGGFTVPAGPGAPSLSLSVKADVPIVVEERLTYPTSGMSSPLAVPVVK